MAKIDDGAVSNKAVFVAPAILPDDTRDVLGLWLQTSEGAKFWRRSSTTCARRAQGIRIAVADGLKGGGGFSPPPRPQDPDLYRPPSAPPMSFASDKDRTGP
ncbi:transposase [Paenirhodobacter ferrireducens]|uniref:transposase n=1 Tax=Paenirhodobacter ferrireducens TaxID=1215032 RepID=UPI0013E33750|nr:transposase [Sinirhodobacter ferrireducens]